MAAAFGPRDLSEAEAHMSANGMKYTGALNDADAFNAFVLQAANANFNENSTSTPTPTPIPTETKAP